MSERVKVDYCAHTIPEWAVEEGCRTCHQKATHKIEETSGPDTFHPLTAYLCCGCFMGIVSFDCATYPYDIVDAGWTVGPVEVVPDEPWEPPTHPGSDPARKTYG